MFQTIISGEGQCGIGVKWLMADNSRESRMAPTPDSRFIRVASLAELQARGVIVIAGPDRPIAVYWHDGQVHAVDKDAA